MDQAADETLLKGFTGTWTDNFAQALRWIGENNKWRDALNVNLNASGKGDAPSPGFAIVTVLEACVRITEGKSFKAMSTNNGNASAQDSKKTSAPATAEPHPTAKVVPGKPGFVFSPYVSSNGVIDVRDMKPGQKVKCPFTQKIFLVP